VKAKGKVLQVCEVAFMEYVCKTGKQIFKKVFSTRKALGGGACFSGAYNTLFTRQITFNTWSAI
jgi:hypothetical protein